MPLTWLHILPPATQNMVRLPRSMADSRHQADRDRTFFESDHLPPYASVLLFAGLLPDRPFRAKGKLRPSSSRRSRGNSAQGSFASFLFSSVGGLRTSVLAACSGGLRGCQVKE